MTDYKESEVIGKKWRRCFQLAVHNHRGNSPSIQFFEEDVMTVDESVLRLGEVSCSVAYDPEAMVEIYDPETLEPTGDTFTHAQLYGMLFSAYIDTAFKRDEAEQPQPEPEPEPTPEE